MSEEPYIPLGFIYPSHLGKRERFFKAWREGRQFGYPICCILRFAIESVIQDGKFQPIRKGQAVRRGCVYGHKRPDSLFVPCNIFHHKTHSYWETINL